MPKIKRSHHRRIALTAVWLAGAMALWMTGAGAHCNAPAAAGEAAASCATHTNSGGSRNDRHHSKESMPPAVLKRLLGGADITAMHELPTAGGLMAVQAGGKLYILSKNGRFLFDGTLRDTWQGGRALDSMGDIERYALRLDLDGMGLKFSNLVSMRVGHGPKTVTAFVSLGCSACRKALTELQALGDTYSVRVVIVPSALEDTAVERIDCTPGADDKLAMVLHAHPAKPAHGATAKALCPDAKAHVMTTKMVARVLGIHRVPFIVAPDGRVTQGLPRNESLATFLAGSEIAQ